MDACKKSILGYQVSDNRAVGPCILAMRMALGKFKTFPGKALKLIADGYSTYPLASQQCKLEKGWDFDVTHFLRPHPYNYWKPLNELDAFKDAENMPAKWQILIYLGQKAILNMQQTQVV